MRIGFDYWQVLSHYPAGIGQLVDALTGAGHSIFVVSAVGTKRVGTVEGEVRKLGFSLPVHEVVFESPKESPELKLAKCRELGITMFFDDRDDVCRLLNKEGILAFRVTRKDNSTYDLKGDLEAERT